jgi:hypothetical protein
MKLIMTEGRPTPKPTPIAILSDLFNPSYSSSIRSLVGLVVALLVVVVDPDSVVSGLPLVLGGSGPSLDSVISGASVVSVLVVRGREFLVV